ncbi:MAG: hypothetical protein M1822_002897 [Bathelium mastoideum]|nr:MAG: hypothetical protein M1822_002897 [Bathelium mastoideum]
MPASDYNSAGGGALKLKGSKPVGVEKKRKKKKSSTTMTSREAPSPSRAPPTESKESEDVKDDSEREDLDGQIIRAEKKSDDSNTLQAIKTRAEREQEERRRKRVSIAASAIHRALEI